MPSLGGSGQYGGDDPTGGANMDQGGLSSVSPDYTPDTPADVKEAQFLSALVDTYKSLTPAEQAKFDKMYGGWMNKAINNVEGWVDETPKFLKAAFVIGVPGGIPIAGVVKTAIALNDIDKANDFAEGQLKELGYSPEQINSIMGGTRGAEQETSSVTEGMNPENTDSNRESGSGSGSGFIDVGPPANSPTTTPGGASAPGATSVTQAGAYQPNTFGGETFTDEELYGWLKDPEATKPDGTPYTWDEKMAAVRTYMTDEKMTVDQLAGALNTNLPEDQQINPYDLKKYMGIEITGQEPGNDPSGLGPSTGKPYTGGYTEDGAEDYVTELVMNVWDNPDLTPEAVINAFYDDVQAGKKRLGELDQETDEDKARFRANMERYNTDYAAEMDKVKATPGVAFSMGGKPVMDTSGQQYSIKPLKAMQTQGDLSYKKHAGLTGAEESTYKGLLAGTGTQQNLTTTGLLYDQALIDATVNPLIDLSKSFHDARMRRSTSNEVANIQNEPQQTEDKSTFDKIMDTINSVSKGLELYQNL